MWSRNCAWAPAGAWDYEDYELLRRQTSRGSTELLALESDPGSDYRRSVSQIPDDTFLS